MKQGRKPEYPEKTPDDELEKKKKKKKKKKKWLLQNIVCGQTSEFLDLSDQ